MAIGEGQIQAELDKVRAIMGAARDIETFIIGVKRALTDGDPIWAVIDPTGPQKTALLAEYDRLKTALKSQVSAY